MFPWSNAPADEHHTPAYAVGAKVLSGSFRGTVVSVDEATMGVVWDDSDDGKPITYPVDAAYLRAAMPWET